MASFKCKNCGGQMELNGASGVECPYCGSKAFFSDADFKNHEEFRQRLLQYYKAEATKKEFDYSGDTFWRCCGSEDLTLQGGDPLHIDYMEKFRYPGATCYLGKENIIYLFDSDTEASRFMAGYKRLVFPEADTRLYRSFPELKMMLATSTGGQVIVFRRRPHFYPAEFFAPWPSEHLAWLISRMENICCALKYAGIEHGDISPTSIWVNTVTHEGALFGDWRNVCSARSDPDLKALRKTAIYLAKDTSKPKELYRFLNSAPAADAFEDFERWDQVIETGFGGHKFVKM